jgi:hypothetical protein
MVGSAKQLLLGLQIFCLRGVHEVHRPDDSGLVVIEWGWEYAISQEEEALLKKLGWKQNTRGDWQF